MYRFLKLFIILLALFGVRQFANWATDGFILSRIASSLESDGEELEQLAVLQQPFSYLASGSQSYVFLSQDNKYVLKFFKENRWQLPFWAYLLPQKQKAALQRRKLEGKSDTYLSCHLCDQFLSAETGIVYLHLQKTKQLPMTQIVDLNDIAHTIDLNKIPFVLQKRGESLGDRLIKLSKEKNLVKGREAISQILHLIVKQRKLGLNDKDPHPITNFGFIDGHAAELDLGGMIIDRNKDWNYFLNKDICKIQKKMNNWLAAYYPELIPIADEEFDRILRE